MKCIIHMDLDCFYAQVEAIRLGIDCETVPFVLNQWGNLIAVNYPARDCGVRRMDSLETAIMKCPTVLYSHVATFKVGETEYKYHERPDKAHFKVSLEPYRDASELLFKHLLTIPNVTIEKAGIDEMFIDATEAARLRLAELVECETEDALLAKAAETTKVLPSRIEASDETGGKFDQHFGAEYVQERSMESLRLLVAGCLVSDEIRRGIKEKYRYCFSAGIAHNKMLAKCISAAHKPNQQTLLPPWRTADFLVDFSFRKLRGLGGKLGEQVSVACGNAVTCGEMWKVSRDQLRAVVGADECDGLYDQLRGLGNDELTERNIAKSLLVQKVFGPPTADIEVIMRWLKVLAGEIVGRTVEFCKKNTMKPKTLRISVGSHGFESMGDILDRRCPIPDPLTEEVLLEIARKWLSALSSGLSNYVGIQVSGFIPVTEKSLGSKQLKLEDLIGAKRSRPTTEPDVVELSSDDDDSVVAGGKDDPMVID